MRPCFFTAALPHVVVSVVVRAVVNVVANGAVLGGVLGGSGCGDGGRAERRAGAHELAGRWLGVDGAVLVVDDEADKNDVVAVLTRPAADPAEGPFIARLPDPAVALALVLGEGVDGVRDEVDGGENVSFDGGVTSTLSLTGPELAADASRGATDARVRWTLLLLTVPDDNDNDDVRRLRGGLQVSVREQRPRAGESDGVTVEAEHDTVAVDVTRE